MRLIENFSLKTKNTFKIDVQCSKYVEVISIEELFAALDIAKNQNEQIFVLGGGSNVLFLEDFCGMVLCPRIMGVNIIAQNNDCVWVCVGAGEAWDDTVQWAVRQGYGGIENLSGIPGNTGAAPTQNIGAYGVEICQAVEEIEAVRISDKKIIRFAVDECRFDYRSSVFKTTLKSQFVITNVILRLQKKAKLNVGYGELNKRLAHLPNVSIADVRNMVLEIRNSKLPDLKLIGNAGSFFKNPIVAKNKAEELLKDFPEIAHFSLSNGEIKLAAGWLIDHCNLKGVRLGDASVYERQALILVNYGNATGLDIMLLAIIVQQSVYQVFGIALEFEVNTI